MSAKRVNHLFFRSTLFWVVVLFVVDGAACFRPLDVSKIPCVDRKSCPTGFYCSGGHCLPDQATVDGGPDGRAGSDVTQSTGGAGGTSRDGAQAQGGAGSPDGQGAGGIAMTDASEATGGTGGTTTLTGAGGSTGGTSGTPDGAADAPPSALSDGTACTGDTECASSHCIDGVCCATTCSGCSACSNALTGQADGTCAPVTSGTNPHKTCVDETATKPCGNDGTCDGKGMCRQVGKGQTCGQASCSTDGNTLTPAATCDGAGTCVPGTAKDCTPYQCAITGCAKTCTKQSDCDTGTYCNTTAGTCATTKSNGTPATETYECTSGIVADGVCCDKACTGCSACTADLNGQAASTTGQCLAVMAGKAAPHNACTKSASSCGLDGTCDGNGACRYPPSGAKCADDSCAGSTLTTSTCNSSHTCSQSNNVCPNSLACASATACATGCTTDAQCVSGYYCASGTCTQKLAPGSVCSSATASQCSSGFCVDGHCCGAQSCGSCKACTGAGGTCVAVTSAEDPDTCTGTSTCDAAGVCKKKTGQTCSVGTDCVTSNCADGYCCNSACNGSCEQCNGGTPGTCSYVSGAPKTGHPACAGSGSCQGTCNGTKSTCTFPGAETTCRQPSCNASTGVATHSATCDGGGNCGALVTNNCTPYICGTNACLTTCTGASQCVSGLACVNGACQSCPTGQTLCGNTCVNLYGSDRNNCGACGRSCPCVNGGCVECTSFSDCATGYQTCTSNKCLCRQPSASNAVQLPGLDAVDAPNFSAVWHPSNSDVVWSTFDADNCPASGSLELKPGTGSGVAFTIGCLSLGSTTGESFGFKYWQDTASTTYCYLNFYSDSSCTTQTSGFPPPTIYLGSTTRSWQSVYLPIDSGTRSLLVSCFFPSQTGSTVYYDQFYVNTGSNTF
jgi:hypothetical protein